MTASAKQHGLFDLFAYLEDVLARGSGHLQAKLDELLPDVWANVRAAVLVEPETVPAT